MLAYHDYSTWDIIQAANGCADAYNDRFPPESVNSDLEKVKAWIEACGVDDDT